MYSRVNMMFGDVVKVTPSSKVVGDMALFIVQNGLDEESVLNRGQNIDFPESVIEFFEGYIGQPHGGFPKELQSVILKERKSITVRPGELLETANFDDIKKGLFEKLERPVTNHEVLAYALYPRVFEEYTATNQQFGNVSALDTLTFLYGMRLGEEIEVEIEKGETLMIKMVSIGEPREVNIQDITVETDELAKPKADLKNDSHIAANYAGNRTQSSSRSRSKSETWGPLACN